MPTHNIQDIEFAPLEKLKGISGIYFLFNIFDKKIYVGSSVDLCLRLKDHFKKLFGGYHYNNHLQSAWRKYGFENFRYRIVQIVENIENLHKVEQSWIDWTQCYKDEIGYNFCPVARSTSKKPISIETRLKMSLAKKGVPLSVEHRKNIGLASTGRIKSEEERRKLSIANKGKHFGNLRVKWICPDGYYCKCAECRKRKAAEAKRMRLVRNARKC